MVHYSNIYKLKSEEKNNKITILGAGPAGMGVAYYCHKANIEYLLFEKSNAIGGNCQTFIIDEFRFDSGAHRLHDKDRQTTKEIKLLMGEDLAKINVPSQIYLEGKYINFPLSPWNLMRFLGFFQSVKDFTLILFNKIKNRSSKHKNFQEFAISTYGRKLANIFLIGYSEKLWGLPAYKLSTEIAGNRLKGLSIKNLIIEIFNKKTNQSKHLDGSFYYPKYGIGSIFEKMRVKTAANNYHLKSQITKVFHNGKRIEKIEINNSFCHDIDLIVSSLSLDILGRAMQPTIPKKIIKVIDSIKYRDIILCTFFINKKNINKNGSIYFPSEKYWFTRIYEAKNRSKYMSPKNKTSLSVEIPTQSNSPIWQLEEGVLEEEITKQLLSLNLFSKNQIIGLNIKKIKRAYPILDNHYKEKIDIIMDYFKGFNNLIINGRNGKFQYTHIHDHMKDARKIVKKIKNNLHNELL